MLQITGHMLQGEHLRVAPCSILFAQGIPILHYPHLVKSTILPGQTEAPLKNFTELYDIVVRDFCNGVYLKTGEKAREIYNYMFFYSDYLSVR